MLKHPLMPYTKGLLRSVPRMGWTEGARVRSPPSAARCRTRLMLPPGCSFHPRCPCRDPARCDARLPDLEDAGGGHDVRCLRWREILDAA